MQLRRAIFAAILASAMIGLGRPSFARDYVIAPGDVLKIEVLGETSLTADKTVNSEGMIIMPLLGDLKVTGMTKEQVDEELTKRLSKYLKDPDVTVNITNPANTLVFVTGEVASPGDKLIKPDTRLLEVLNQAGGLKETADKSRIILSRDGKETVIDYIALQNGDMAGNQVIEIGDRIHVPKKEGFFTKTDTVGKVKVLGEVTTPGEKDLAAKMTPMEAITAAGGFKETSDRRNVQLMHPDGVIAKLDLDAVSRGVADPLMQNLYLKDGDVMQVNGFGKIQVLGDVASPGYYPLSANMTILSAIQTAGKFNATADQSAVTIRRADGTLKTVDIAKVLRGELDVNDPINVLSTDDIVFVPNNKNSQVVITGPGVKTAGQYSWTEGMTVIQALDLAGGTNERAKIDKIVVAPKEGEARIFNLKKFANGDVTQNFPVEKGSTIMVGMNPQKSQEKPFWEQMVATTLVQIPTMYISKWIWSD